MFIGLVLLTIMELFMKLRLQELADRPPLWLVPSPEPLRAFFRPHGRDLTKLSELVAAGHRLGAGVVVDGRLVARAGELAKAVKVAGLQVVLDST
jgi:D-serine deaminase-like pyridoxal phosphate-dependent protein